MPYLIVSIIAHLVGAGVAGVQFAHILKSIQGQRESDGDPAFRFSCALLAFAIPFFTPIDHNIGASASLFIALTAVITLLASRTRVN